MTEHGRAACQHQNCGPSSLAKGPSTKCRQHRVSRGLYGWHFQNPQPPGDVQCYVLPNRDLCTLELPLRPPRGENWAKPQEGTKPFRGHKAPRVQLIPQGRLQETAGHSACPKKPLRTGQAVLRRLLSKAGGKLSFYKLLASQPTSVPSCMHQPSSPVHLSPGTSYKQLPMPSALLDPRALEPHSLGWE